MKFVIGLFLAFGFSNLNFVEAGMTFQHAANRGCSATQDMTVEEADARIEHAARFLSEATDSYVCTCKTPGDGGQCGTTTHTYPKDQYSCSHAKAQCKQDHQDFEGEACEIPCVG